MSGPIARWREQRTARLKAKKQSRHAAGAVADGYPYQAQCTCGWLGEQRTDKTTAANDIIRHHREQR